MNARLILIATLAAASLTACNPVPHVLRVESVTVDCPPKGCPSEAPTTPAAPVDPAILVDFATPPAPQAPGPAITFEPFVAPQAPCAAPYPACGRP